MNRWAAYPQLGGTSVNVRWLGTPSIGEPHLNGGKETYVGETGEAELPPIPPPPSPEDIDLEEATIPHLFTTRSVV
jgi:hypothetical protein